jgi:hypothetical protein
LLTEQPVYQKAYTNNTDYSDEWLLTYLTGSINLNVVFDGAYNTLYSNAATRISNELGVLKVRYLIDFGIVVNYNTPTQIISLPEKEDENGNRICSANYREACDCVNEDGYPCTDSDAGSVFEYHHTNMLNIFFNYVVDYNDTIINHFVIVYTGYDVCMQDNHDSLYGLAYPSCGLMGISNSLGNTQETKTLVHEVGHMYSVIDHYDDEEDDDNVKTTNYLNLTVGPWYDDDCIYGRNKATVASSLTICEGCRRTIEANAADFNHN